MRGYHIVVVVSDKSNLNYEIRAINPAGLACRFDLGIITFT